MFFWDEREGERAGCGAGYVLTDSHRTSPFSKEEGPVQQDGKKPIGFFFVLHKDINK